MKRVDETWSALLSMVAWVLLAAAASQAATQKFFPDPVHGVEDSYMVLLPRSTPASEVADEATLLTATYGGQVEVRWKRALRGFLADMSEKQARNLSQDPGVVAVWQNRRYVGEDALRATSNTAPYCYGTAPLYPEWPPGASITFNSPLPAPAPATQAVDCENPDPEATDCLGNWGLDRIDGFGASRDGEWSYLETGFGVRIFVPDTGIRDSHKEFLTTISSRVAAGIDGTQPQLPSGDPDCSQPSAEVIHPHGTHVAGIAGGNEFGVAKQVSLVPVRHFALNVQGIPALEDTWVVNGLECILEDHPPTANTAIVNLSGLNDFDWPENVLIQQAVIGIAERDNLLFIQSAGNFYPTDACTDTYGDESAFIGAEAEAVARVLVAGGSDEIDAPFEFTNGDGQPDVLGTNLGPCVDLFAPADHVISAWWANSENPGQPDAGVCRLAGTSMAAPHVAGVAALMLEKKRDATAPELRGDLLDHAVRGAMVFDTAEELASPNLLLHRDDNRIFWNGFHHDLSRWWLGGDAGALSHCDWAGTVFGDEATALCVDLGGAAAWVEDRRPLNEASYDFYFRFDFTQAQMVSEHVFFEARTSSGSPVLRLKVRPAAVSSTVEIGFFAFSNSGVEVGSWAEAPAREGFVRGNWEAATSGALSGSVGFSPEGYEVPVTVQTGNNSNLRIGEARLGAMGSLAGTSGTERFRQFRSWRVLEADLDVPAFDP